MLYCYWCIRSPWLFNQYMSFSVYAMAEGLFFLFCNNSKIRPFQTIWQKRKKKFTTLFCLSSSKNSVHDSLLCVSSSCDCSQSVQDTHMACERHRRRIKNVKLSSTLLRFHLWDKTCRSRHHQTLPELHSLIQFYSNIFFHQFRALVSLFLKSCHFSSKAIVFSSLHIRVVLTNVIFSLRIFHQSSCVSSILH